MAVDIVVIFNPSLLLISQLQNTEMEKNHLLRWKARDIGCFLLQVLA